MYRDARALGHRRTPSSCTCAAPSRARAAGHRPGRRRRLRDGDPHLRQRLRHRERATPRTWRSIEGARRLRALESGIALGGYSLLASRSDRRRERRHQPEDGEARRTRLRQLAVPGQPLGRRTTSASSRQFYRADRPRRPRARRLLPGRRLRLHDASRPPRARRFAVGPVADDQRLLPLVPRARAST